jgi:hypothetical protein
MKLIGIIVLALWPQATAQISGRVTDQSGAVLPGVEITATQTDTGILRNAITDETGSFILPNLATGPYRLQAALSGFRTFVQTGIVLQVSSNPVINPVLEVGQLTEEVEVQANAAMVETRTVGVGVVIENQRILELPLDGRQPTSLITLSGAAVQTEGGTSGAGGARRMAGAVGISVAGGLSTGTVYLLDGAMHNSPYDNFNLPLPFPDALQEFKVETGGLSAQHGMYSGASVNSVTKSGTNEFHGNAFEFIRNDLFNARNYFARKNSTLKRNQFGGTLGGPIQTNKLFFFGGYQGTIIRQDPSDLRDFVPSPAMLAGDFTAFASPACNGGRQITLRAPFVNNQIAPGQFNRAALALTAKLPKTSDPCGGVTRGERQISNNHQALGRVDYQMTSKQSLFGRTMFVTYKEPSPFSLDSTNILNNIVSLDQFFQSYAIGHTYLISPNTVNSFRLVVNRTATDRVAAEYFSAPDIGINIFSFVKGSMSVDVTGGFSLGGNPGPTRTTAYQAANDLSLIRGTHQIGIGGNVAYWRNNLNALTGASRGAFTFSGDITGLGMADFLVGRPSRFMQRAPNTTYMSQPYIGAYIADSWRVAPRLTVNYGVRWEPYFPQVYRNGKIANFSESRYKAGVKSTVFRNAPTGFYYPGDPDFPGTSCRSSGICNATGINKRWWDFAPRLGFAWDVSGDGRTSVRASFATGYDMITAGSLNTAITPPWEPSITIETPAGGFENPWLGYPGGNPFPIGAVDPNTPFPAFSNYFSIPYDNPRTTRYSWNLSVQRQIATDWLVSASYLGSQTAHIWVAQELNQALFVPGATTANANNRRRLPLTYPNIGGTPIGFLSEYQAVGTQSYHGLLTSIQRRAASGVTVGGNYTWSHCYGDNHSPGGNPGVTLQDPNNRALDRGNCDSDRRHILNVTTVAQTPQFTNTTLRALVTGWRLSGIYRWSTGSYLTITSGVNRSLTGVSNERPDQVLVNPYGNKTLTNYLNPAAFAQPALGSLGNMGPRNIKGPNSWQFDLALSRVFGITEAQRLEVRAEAYNVTNSLRPLNPVTVHRSGTFGQILTASDPRILQFALKYVF